MDKELLKPVFIFETSWEVCNKVGVEQDPSMGKGKDPARI